MISVDELRQLSGLLDEALDLSDAERAAWLEGLEGDAARLEPALRRLLQRPASRETAQLLDSGPSFSVATADTEPPGFSAGDTVGPYRLLRELGRGGMGEVWLAERTDGQLKRPVALKLPMPGARRSMWVERFARERDILGGLVHPHIARLYDAGLTADGQPYMALEYVAGTTLTVYCDQHRVGTGQRLSLALQVLDAVQYAHTRLVIHRDLKPGNILVSDDGEVRLLDFGIAKLLVDEGSAGAPQLTQLAGHAFTPDYASPEQVRGDKLGTASDVYALGVVLYELLCGQRPYRLKHHSAAQLELAILETDPPLPSSRVDLDGARARAASVADLQRQLRGDLDTIVLKALKKRPEDRYATAAELADDLRRHRDGMPVLARPDALGYRARKFIGRHRWPLAFSAAAAAALLAGLGAAVWNAREAARERDHALMLLARNEAVTELFGMLTSEMDTSRPMTASDLMGLTESLSRSAFRHAPEKSAAALSIVGMYHYKIDDGVKAESLLRSAIDAARDSKDPSFKARLRCQHAAALQLVGRSAESRRELVAAAGQSSIDAGTVAECLYFLAYAEASDASGQPGQAVTWARQALHHLTASARRSPDMEANYTAMLALALTKGGHIVEARRAYAQALATYADLGRETSAEATGVRSDAAVTLQLAGDPRSALALMDENLQLIARRAGGEPSALLLVNRAVILRLLGRREAAAQAFRSALPVAERDPNPSWSALCLLGMAELALDGRDVAQAQRLLAQAQSQQAAVWPHVPAVEERVSLVRGRLAALTGRPQEAREAFTATIAKGHAFLRTVESLRRRAELGLDQGQLASALQDADAATALARKLQGDSPFSCHTGESLLLKGRVLATMGEAASARAAYQGALQHLVQSVEPGHPALQQVRALLGAAGS